MFLFVTSLALVHVLQADARVLDGYIKSRRALQ